MLLITLKAMNLNLGLGVDKFKGGHFTVWNKTIKTAVNNARASSDSKFC